MMNIDIKSTPNMPKNGGFLKDYTWMRLLKKEQTVKTALKPALFLDRDGVINVEKSFITYPDMLELEDGIVELIRYYNQQNWPVIVVTNQSGIAKEKINWATYWLIEDRLIQDLSAQGAFLDLILACPCHPDGITPYNTPKPPSRKPAPGMIHTANELFAINKKQSVIIGDRLRDIEAGYNAGLVFGILRDSNHAEGKIEWENANTDMFAPLKLKKIKNISEALPMIKEMIK